MPTYIIIERQHSADLSIEYPDFDAAVADMDSLFIEGLCQEDALDCYVQSTWPLKGSEIIIPPTQEERN